MKSIEKEEVESENESAIVSDFVRKEVSDWDDVVKCQSRFKALSGQRSDWEPLYLFWRNLILNVSRHLGVFIIRTSRVKRTWFRRNGLAPLCIERVIEEMHRTGELLPIDSYSDQTTNANSFRISQFLSKALDFILVRKYDSSEGGGGGDDYILAPLLKERALEVVKSLSENHWTASCVITMRKFQEICRGSNEALAILNYLSQHGKSKHIVMNTTERIEGVKVCLASSGTVASASSTEYSVLHLTWTAEKLEQQLDLIDQRYQKNRNSALASLKTGNKRVALRYARELKLASLSIEKCTTLLDRVEKVLQAIADAESSKKVFEAIQKSTLTIKGNQISVEEVETCMQEIYENIHSLEQVGNVLQSPPAYGELDDADVEDEFDKLQLDICSETSQVSSENGYHSVVGVPEILSNSDELSIALSNLNLKNGAAVECCEKQKQKQKQKQKPLIAT